MKLISQIEVNYLRSLYRLEIKSAGDLNVVFGRNDSGKSNLLRALNLFFNGHTDPERIFDFDLDMSDIRKKEARDVKGRQFIWIKITFNTPENYVKSLGSEIQVKKQWNRDGEISQTVWPKELREGAVSRRFTRFMNDINFTYIPAIKDISLYSDLVERLYGAASQSQTVAKATKAFVTEVGHANSNLTKSLQKLFDSKSSFSAPTELSQLFRSLDFSYGDEGHSLLRQKGDGIKARHIPEILRAINDGEQRSKFYLWGFEEPENSLDLSAAGSEAVRFAEISSRNDTQIFLTSHSPAFYLSEADNCMVKRLFISKQTKTEDGIRPENAVQVVESLDDAEVVMESAGLFHLPYVIRSLKSIPDKLNLLEADKQALENRLKKLEKPTIFFEGKHDLDLVSHRFEGDTSFCLREVGGTPNTIPSLLNSIEQDGQLNLGSRALMVFDNDPSGRSAMKKIIGRDPNEYTIPYSVAGQLSIMCLPHNHCEHFNAFKSYVGLNESDIIFEGEFLLDPTLVATELAKLSFNRDALHEDYFKKPQSIYLKMREYEEGSPGWLFARTVPDNLKSGIIRAVTGNGNTPSLDQLESVIREFMA